MAAETADTALKPLTCSSCTHPSLHHLEKMLFGFGMRRCAEKLCGCDLLGSRPMMVVRLKACIVPDAIPGSELSPLRAHQRRHRGILPDVRRSGLRLSRIALSTSPVG